MSGVGWMADAKARTTFPQVATELGMTLARSRTWGPCPGCGATKRGSGDSRGPIGVSDNRGWRCHRCDAGGSVIDLVLHLVPDRGEARAWFASRGWCEPAQDAPAAPRIEPRPAPEQEPEPVALDSAEVAELWQRCGPAYDAPAVNAWIRARGLDPDVVTERDLGRALPLTLPRWASHWPRLGCGIVLPLFDARGVLAGLQGRRVVAGDGPKSVAARGVKRVGILADATAQAVLREGRPSWWTGREVVVTEGEPDWLTWACWVASSVDAPAVLGLPGGGAWTKAIADRVPDRVRVDIKTHDDEAGRRYRDQIRASLRSRCTIRYKA